MKNENIEEILKRLGAEDVPADVHKIAQEASERFSVTLTQSRQHILWEHIMKSPVTKFAAAAVIVIAIIIGISQIGGSAVVLAGVLEKVEQARAFMYTMNMKMTGNMMPGMPAGEAQGQYTIIISNDYGMKMESVMEIPTGTLVQQMYVLPQENAMYMVMPDQKQYMKMELDDDWLTRMKKQSNDPRDMIKQILNSEYIELGRKVIDGVEVEGFQTTDPAYAGGMMEDLRVVLWVDVESCLPVRAEMYFSVNEQMQMEGVIEDFVWDVQVDASEFEPAIGEDYTTLPGSGMQMPETTEEAAIEGLRFLAEMTGEYPQRPNIMNLLTTELIAIMDRNNLTEAGLRLKEDMEKLPTDQQAQKLMEIMRPVQSFAIFYMTLVQEKKEPAYYGDSVTPEDADAVLLRWKISDNEYRVIFGDLSTETVTAEQLAELERQTPY